MRSGIGDAHAVDRSTRRATDGRSRAPGRRRSAGALEMAEVPERETPAPGWRRICGCATPCSEPGPGPGLEPEPEPGTEQEAEQETEPPSPRTAPADSMEELSGLTIRALIKRAEALNIPETTIDEAYDRAAITKLIFECQTKISSVPGALPPPGGGPPRAPPLPPPPPPLPKAPTAPRTPAADSVETSEPPKGPGGLMAELADGAQHLKKAAGKEAAANDSGPPSEAGIKRGLATLKKTRPRVVADSGSAGLNQSADRPEQYGGPSADGASWVNAKVPDGMDIIAATAWKTRQKAAKAEWEEQNGLLNLTFSKAKAKQMEEDVAGNLAQYGAPNAEGTAWVDKDVPNGLDMMEARQWKTAQQEARAKWEAAH
eukprot:COSAG02_NODE_4460_length_5337_cov_27.113211_1_plen_373_part_00